jgi:hypothetical protein
VSGNRFVFEGLDELKEALRNLPSELTGEASHDVEAAANGAAAILKSEYHRVSGKLRDGVDVTFGRDQFSTGAIVKSKSPSHGSMTTVHKRGTTPRRAARSIRPGPCGVRRRRPMFRAHHDCETPRMYERLKALLTRHGLLVSGDGE